MPDNRLYVPSEVSFTSKLSDKITPEVYTVLGLYESHKYYVIKKNSSERERRILHILTQSEMELFQNQLDSEKNVHQNIIESIKRLQKLGDISFQKIHDVGELGLGGTKYWGFILDEVSGFSLNTYQEIYGFVDENQKSTKQLSVEDGLDIIFTLGKALHFLCREEIMYPGLSTKYIWMQFDARYKKHMSPVLMDCLHLGTIQTKQYYFWSPERLRNPHEIKESSLVYELGVLLATLWHPEAKIWESHGFSDNIVSLLQEKQNPAIQIRVPKYEPKHTKEGSKILKDISGIIKKALEPIENKRYSSIGGFLYELQKTYIQKQPLEEYIDKVYKEATSPLVQRSSTSKDTPIDRIKKHFRQIDTILEKIEYLNDTNVLTKLQFLDPAYVLYSGGTQKDDTQKIDVYTDDILQLSTVRPFFSFSSTSENQYLGYSISMILLQCLINKDKNIDSYNKTCTEHGIREIFLNYLANFGLSESEYKFTNLSAFYVNLIKTEATKFSDISPTRAKLKELWEADIGSFKTRNHQNVPEDIPVDVPVGVEEPLVQPITKPKHPGTLVMENPDESVVNSPKLSNNSAPTVPQGNSKNKGLFIGFGLIVLGVLAFLGLNMLNSIQYTSFYAADNCSAHDCIQCKADDVDCIMRKGQEALETLTEETRTKPLNLDVSKDAVGLCMFLIQQKRFFDLNDAIQSMCMGHVVRLPNGYTQWISWLNDYKNVDGSSVYNMRRAIHTRCDHSNDSCVQRYCDWVQENMIKSCVLPLPSNATECSNTEFDLTKIEAYLRSNWNTCK